MARHLALLLALAAVLACAQSRSLQSATSGRNAADARSLIDVVAGVAGWSGALVVTGKKDTYCGLNHFPPIPGGYGTNKVQCGGKTAAYDHFWMWRLERVTGGASEPTVMFKTGEQLYLSIAVPMLPYCQLPKNKPGQMKCGVVKKSATAFTIEAADKPGVAGLDINIATTPFYIKGAGKYCSMQGKNDFAYLTCNQAAPGSSFRMPYDAYYKVSVANTKATEMAQAAGANTAGVKCGFNFIPLTGLISAVNCTTVPAAIPGNYITDFYIALQAPWSTAAKPALTSGMGFTFKAHDSLYRYQISTWTVEKAAPHRLKTIDNDTSDPAQWFVMEKAGADAGDAIASGDKIMIKNSKYNMYCGLSSTSQLVCDKASATVADTAYTYAFTM